MKRTISIILVLLFIATLCSCNQSQKATTYSSADSTIEQVDTEPIKTELKPLVDKIQTAINQGDWTIISDFIVPSYPQERFVVADLTNQTGEAFRKLVPVLADALENSDKQITIDYVSESISDKKGTVTYSVKKTGSSDYNETISVVLENGTWYIDATAPDNQIPKTETLASADLSTAETFQRGKYIGLCSAEQEELIKPYFDEIGSYVGDYCTVKKDDKWGIIDNDGNLIADYIFDDVRIHPYLDYWWVKYNEKWGAVSFTNKKIVACQYDEILYGNEDNGYISIKNGEKCGLISSDGKSIIPVEYDDIGCASSDTDIDKQLIPVKKGEYWGVVDESNTKVVDFIYTDIAKSYIKNMICVGINGSYGVIDRSGEYVIRITTDYKSFTMLNNIIILYDGSDDEYYAHFKLYDYSGKQILADYDFADKPVSMSNGDCFAESYAQRRSNVPDLERQYFIIKPDATYVNLSEKIFESLEKSFPDLYKKAIKDFWSTYEVKPTENEGYYEVNCFLATNFTSGTWKYNCISSDGTLLISDWTNHINNYQSVDDYIIYDYSESKESYDYYLVNTKTNESSKVGTGLSMLEYYSKNNEVLWTSSNGSIRLVKSNSIVYLVDAEKQKIYTLSEYAGVDFQLSEKELNSNAIIVTDGVLFGLLTQNGLAGGGVVYTDYSYDKDTGDYEMIYGADKKEKFRILPNGDSETSSETSSETTSETTD